MEGQIAHFTQRMGQVFYNGARVIPEKNWDETFARLTETFKSIDEKTPVVLFLDEFP